MQIISSNSYDQIYNRLNNNLRILPFWFCLPLFCSNGGGGIHGYDTRPSSNNQRRQGLFLNGERQNYEYVNLLQHQDDGFNLQNGREISVRLESKRPRDYYFPVTGDGSNIWLVVTPCGGMIKWKLAQQQRAILAENNGDFLLIDDDDDEWFPNKPANSSIIGDNNYLDLKRGQQHERWFSSAAARQSDKLMVRLPVAETMLVKEVGEKAMEYSRDNAPAGVNLHLYVLAAENDSLATKIYVLESKNGGDAKAADKYFPKLPRRKRVQLHNITKTSVSVVWDHSPSVNMNKFFGVEYCLILSTTRHYSTFCDFEEESKKILSTKKRRPSNVLNSQQTRREAGYEQQKQENRNSPVYACTRFKTEYFFDRLKPNTKYHLSLFAVNVRTGGSVAYEGSSLVNLSENMYYNTIIKMTDGQLYASYLNPTRSSFQIYEIVSDKFRRHLVITVQPCTGYLRVNLYKDGQILRKSVFDDLKSFVISNVQPGSLRIKVINDDNESKLFKIWASRRSSRNPYPRLPVDPSLKAPESGRTCRSVELAWLTAADPAPHEYILYERVEEEGYFKRLILEQSNQCLGPPSQARKVFFRREMIRNSLLDTLPDKNDAQGDDLSKMSRSRNRRNVYYSKAANNDPPKVGENEDDVEDISSFDEDQPSIMTEKVTGLKASTTYRFDLYVSKPNRQQLPYRTIWVKTKSTCDDDETANYSNLDDQDIVDFVD